MEGHRKNIKDRPYRNVMGNRAEGHGFADKRKKQAVSSYQKLMRKEQKQMFDTSSPAGTRQFQQPASSDDSKPRSSKYFKAQKEFKSRKNQQQKQQDARQKIAEEKAEALNKYKQRKKQTHKLLAKRTYKGQPNMAAQMQNILNKLEAEKS